MICKGGVKARRDRSICNTLTSYTITEWVGKVEKIDSNSDGKGVLAVTIAPDMTVGTWNNEISDIGSNTLIEPGSQVFESASAMKNGQLVIFSGTFFPGSSGDCLNESSLTLNGKVETPEFIFRFTSVSAYNTYSKPIQTSQETNPAPIEVSKPSGYTSAVSQEPKPIPQEDFNPTFTQPQVLKEPVTVPVTNSERPTQVQNIAETVPQAIVLWNQKRYAEAIPLFNRACDDRQPVACYYLGMMYDFGHGLAQSVSHAREFYLKACQAGNEAACGNLNIVLSYDPDLIQCKPPRSEILVNHNSESCNSGDGISCATLGHLYSYGCGVPKDAEEARQVYNKACISGSQLGCDRLKEMQ